MSLDLALLFLLKRFRDPTVDYISVSSQGKITLRFQFSQVVSETRNFLPHCVFEWNLTGETSIHRVQDLLQVLSVGSIMLRWFKVDRGDLRRRLGLLFSHFEFRWKYEGWCLRCRYMVCFGRRTSDQTWNLSSTSWGLFRRFFVHLSRSDHLNTSISDSY